MYIDLKAPNQPNLESVRAMVAAADDSRNSQLRVTTSGIASIWYDCGWTRLEGVLFFPEESYCAANGYVGEGAANDDEWVRENLADLQKMKRIFQVLRTNGAWADWMWVDGYEGPMVNRFGKPCVWYP